MNAMRLRGVILLLYYVERLIHLMPVINDRLVKFSPYQHLFDPVWVRPCNSKNEHCTTVLPSSLTIYLKLSGKKTELSFWTQSIPCFTTTFGMWFIIYNMVLVMISALYTKRLWNNIIPLIDKSRIYKFVNGRV